MTKLTLLSALCMMTFMQIQGQSHKPCKKLCTVERVIYKDAFLGVKLYGKCESKQAQGAIVKEVVAGTVAATTILQESDVITYLDDIRIYDNVQLVKELKKMRPQQRVNIAFRRGDIQYEFDVALGARHEEVVTERICCDAKLSVEVYPNPVHDNLAVRINNPDAVALKWELSSMTGVVVMQANVSDPSTKFSEERISVAALPDGIYILKVSGKDTVVTKKIVVKH